MSTVADNLVTCVRLVLCELELASRFAAGPPTVDTRALQLAIDGVREELKKIANIQTAVGKGRDQFDIIGQQAESLRRGIESKLTTMEIALRFPEAP
jgi:hypothetical protein